MFSGIVERMARVTGVVTTTGGKRLDLRVDEGDPLPPWRAAAVGDSIAVDGVCLTAVKAGGPHLSFDVVPESLSRTTLGNLSPGDPANIECSLGVGDRFGGHYVTGHVDGTGEVIAREPEGDQVLFRIGAGRKLLDEMIVKGSVAVDGVALTIVDISRAAGWFTFAAIPHTLEITTLGCRRVGDPVNLETDAFGKWVLHGMREMGLTPPG